MNLFEKWKSTTGTQDGDGETRLKTAWQEAQRQAYFDCVRICRRREELQNRTCGEDREIEARCCAEEIERKMKEMGYE